MHSFYRLWLITCLTGVAIFLGHALAFAQSKIRCECEFDSKSGYRAYGTRSACSQYTRIDPNKNTVNCEIAFAGFGYDERLLSKINITATNYRNKALDITMRNIAAIAKRDLSLFGDESFLREAIPVYMRAAYLRVSAELPQDIKWQELDREVKDFSSEYAKLISEVFLGSEKAFDKPWRKDGHIYVERGAIRFVYKKQITISTIFFDLKDLTPRD